MQYPSPGEENPVMSARPKCHSYLPVHLRDYEGWRQKEQVRELNTGKHRRRLDEHPTANSALRISPHSSRSTSPVSQYAEYATLDQWNVSDECQAAKSQLDYYPQWYLAGPARGMAAPCSSSPFHRP